MMQRNISKKAEWLGEKVMRVMNLSKPDLQSIVNLKDSIFMKILREYLSIKHNATAESLMNGLNQNNERDTLLKISELKGRMKVAEDILNFPMAAEKILKDKIKSKKKNNGAKKG
jgi:hypothetical protein